MLQKVQWDEAPVWNIYFSKHDLLEKKYLNKNGI